jgi:hypothetical protein
MPPPPHQEAARPNPGLAAIMNERRRLIDRAYRLLGSRADAGDARSDRLTTVTAHARYASGRLGHSCRARTVILCACAPVVKGRWSLSRGLPVLGAADRAKSMACSS